VCLKNICVFSHYMLWYMTVYIIRYLCIFSLHVGCCRSWQSLIDGSSWLIFWSINLSWSGLIEQRSSQVFAPKIGPSSSGNTMEKICGGHFYKQFSRLNTEWNSCCKFWFKVSSDYKHLLIKTTYNYIYNIIWYNIW